MIMLQLPILRKDEKGTQVVMETISVKYILRISPTVNNTANIWLAYSGINLETILSYSEVLEKLTNLQVVDGTDQSE